LLLLLRLLAVILVVITMSRPFIGQSASAGVSSATPAAFVVLLDYSMSMGSTHQGISIFNTARSRALEILDQMNADDRATVGLINDPGRLVFPQLTWDTETLKKSIANAPLSMAGTNLATSILPALKILAPLANYRRAVYVITDMTESAWQPFIEKYDLARVEPGIDLIMVPVGGTAPENMSVKGLEADAPVIMTGRKVPVKVKVANYSTRARKTRLTISLNGERKLDREVEIEAGLEKETIVEVTFSATGMNHLTASLPADALPGDDERHLAVRVFEPCKILVIKPDNKPGQPENREDIFVRFALNPLNRSKENNFVVESRGSGEVNNLDLKNYAALVMINQHHLEAPFVKKVSDYLLAGGNLITFLGDRAEPEWYNKNLIDDLGGGYLLPARIFKRVGNAVSRSVGYQLTDLDAGHPAFSIFARDGNGDPGRAQIFEFFQVRPNPAALLLSRLSHGLPGIIEEKRGRGRSMLVTFSADTSWTNWPVRPTWLPFLHQTLVSMITAGDLSIGTIRPGMPVSATISAEANDKIVLKMPDGAEKSVSTQSSAQGLIHFTTRDTDLSGYYEIRNAGGKKLVGAFAVNPPPEESRLDRINLRKIPRFIPLAHDPGRGPSVKEKVSLLRDGYDLGAAALLLLVLLAVIESWAANRPADRKNES
ncbi:MAG: VWA domain-containing protein, partial [Candidatus Riflebacteria bacterium]|nr:VWA domain-containing protein [Candidatus Riflebacteria bacterium]